MKVFWNGYKRLTLFCLAVALSIVLCWMLDKIYPLELEKEAWSTLVTAKDGTPLRAFADDNGVWRYPATLNDLSPLYIEALLTYEDRWFYYHPGVNIFSMIRATFQNIKAKKIVSGGSTLTMQTARLLHPHPRTILGKCYQMLRAFQLERHLSKNEILTLYLNLAPFGSNIEGVQTASFIYLGKPGSQLSHAEAALLAVLPQAPSFFRPDRHPDRAKNARNKVLDRMLTFNKWSDEIIREAKKEPVIAMRFSSPVIAPLAARRLYFRSKNQSKITTLLDADLQIHLAWMLSDYVSDISRDHSGAILVVDYKNLEIKAYVGSSDFSSKTRKGHVDMVQAIRSPGSALKPFLYGLAMDAGLIHSHSMLLDTPRYQQDYDPGNFTNGFSGPVTVNRALRLSLNVPAVQVLEAYGPQKFHDRLVNAGAKLKMSGEPNLSMILGGLGTNLESLVLLYTALARDGLTGKPQLIPSGKIRQRYLMSKGAAWIILQILKQPVPGYEGISRLSGRIPMAWKTGTSYGFRDAWAFGVMGDYVAGVWVGKPDGSPSPGSYGAETALPLLQRVFQSLPQTDFSKPPPGSVRKENVCWPLGTRDSEVEEKNCHVTHSGWILEDRFPLTMNSTTSAYFPLKKSFWVDANGYRAQPSCGGIHKIDMAVWPIEAEPFIKKSWQRKNLIPSPSGLCPDLTNTPVSMIRITSIQHQSRLKKPPGNKNELSIELTAQGGQGKYHWFLNGKPVTISHQHRVAFMPLPDPGKYQLAVTDQAGQTDMIQFEVEDWQ